MRSLNFLKMSLYDCNTEPSNNNRVGLLWGLKRK